MKCYKCKNSETFSPIFKDDLCKKCYIKGHGTCEKCEEEPRIKESSLCANCIVDYLNIDKIFRDGIINERKNDLNKLNRSNCQASLIISIFSLIISIGLFGFAVVTKDVDDYFILIILCSISLTFYFIWKFIKNKKNIPNKEKMSLRDILLSYNRKFKQIDNIITFGERAEESYDGDINDINDEDILYLSKREDISFLEAKSYIKYYQRILKEIDKVNEKLSFEVGCEKELEEYYEAQEQYNFFINSTNFPKNVLCNQYFDEMVFEELDGLIPSKEYLPYKNIQLYLKLSMPEIILLNNSIEIKGGIKVLLLEDEEIVAQGYIEGSFYNNAVYKIICKKEKDIKNLEKVKIKYELGALLYPEIY